MIVAELMLCPVRFRMDATRLLVNGLPTAHRLHSTAHRRSCVFGCPESVELFREGLGSDSMAHYFGCSVATSCCDGVMPIVLGPLCGLARLGVAPLDWRRLATCAVVYLRGGLLHGGKSGDQGVELNG